MRLLLLNFNITPKKELGIMRKTILEGKLYYRDK